MKQKLKKYWCSFVKNFPGSRYIVAYSAGQAAEVFADGQPQERDNLLVEARCGMEVATAKTRNYKEKQ